MKIHNRLFIREFSGNSVILTVKMPKWRILLNYSRISPENALFSILILYIYILRSSVGYSTNLSWRGANIISCEFVDIFINLGSLFSFCEKVLFHNIIVLILYTVPENPVRSEKKTIISSSFAYYQCFRNAYICLVHRRCAVTSLVCRTAEYPCLRISPDDLGSAHIWFIVASDKVVSHPG